MRHKYLLFSLLFSFFGCFNASAQEFITVRGKVVDATGLQVRDVSVISAKNSKIGAITNEEGLYEISVNQLDSLIFQHVSYNSQTVPVLGNNTINVTLDAITGSMEDVTVVGFGRQRKISVVGAIESINPQELRTPQANLSNSLAGRLAGIIAFQRTGAPGADGSTFYIRGISTYSGATNPLIILDGVEIASGDLNHIAPETIESVSVLKDATATAIYGSRGANGVLILTTKQGRDTDKPGINVRIQNQISAPTSIPKFVDGARYMELYNEAVRTRNGGEILYTDEHIENTRNNVNKYIFPNVNWYNELFKASTMNQEANVNIQGGGSRVGYFMSVTYNQSNGLLKDFDLNSYKNNISVKRWSFQNNINANLTPTTKVSLKLNTQLRSYHGPATGVQDVYANVMNANPVDFPIYFELDSARDRRDVRYGTKAGGRADNNYGIINPFGKMVNGYHDNFQSAILATLEGEQKLDAVTPGLKLRALASFKNWSSSSVTRSSNYNHFEVVGYSQRDDGSYDYTVGMVGQPQNLYLTTSTGTSGDRSIYFQPSLEYNRLFGAHNVSGLLLYNQTEFSVNNPSNLINSLPKRRQGYSGRVTYSYDNRYLFEGNFAYNGSENFARGHRFGFFPSVAVGYVVSNEKYFEDIARVISLFKIRASWGLAGNDQIGSNRFPYLENIALSGAAYTTGMELDYTLSGPVYQQFSNPGVTWEVGEKTNLGVDIGILNRLNLNVDIYREHRTNIFDNLSQSIPSIFGTMGVNVFANVGEVRSQGIDVAMEYTNDFNKDFSLSMRGTFTYATNKVYRNGEPLFTRYPNLSAIGYPINSLLGLEALGLFKDDDDVNSSPLQSLGSGRVQPGDIKYRDVTAGIDSLNIINNDDRIRMGFPTVPEIIYGLSTTVRYKKADFSFLLQGAARTSFFISGFHPFGGDYTRNVLQFIADDYWSEDNPNPNAAYPRLSKPDNNNNTANSSYWLRDGSFLKLRSAEIGYTHKFFRIFVSGYNLLTFSKFKLWDPEEGGGNGLKYPTQRVFNIGAQLRFN